MTTKKQGADEQAELRRLWKKAVREMDEVGAGGDDAMEMNAPRTDWQQFCGLMCGATSKRTGQPCRRKDLFASGRCKFHGGMSTGPRSVAGKERSARNGASTRRGRQEAGMQSMSEPHEVLANPKV